MKSLIRKSYILGILLLASISAMGTTALAADSYTVANGASLEVDEHGTCNDVTNSSGQSIMVPTKTTTEWSSFRSNLPASVSLSACSTPCGGYSYGGYCYYLGAVGKSCDEACSGRGGCNLTGTRYIGSSGTNARCQNVLNNINDPASGSINTGGGSTGCGNSFSVRQRNTATTTCAAKVIFGTLRACACNN